MKKFRLLLAVGSLLLAAATLKANNVQITDVTITNPTHISFNISWDNSWRVTAPPANYDAVWIFVKRALCPNPLVWIHTNVATGGHTVGSPLTVYQDGYNNAGLFLQRASEGYGNISTVPVTLELAPITPAGEYEYKVFAIEMVYIPEGAFYVGDGPSDTQYRFHLGGSPNIPFQITSEGSITMTNSSPNLWATGLTPTSGTVIPADFPKGFDKFYAMKYEITTQQMADFLNYNPQLASTRWSCFFQPVGYYFNQNWINTTWPNFTPEFPWRPFGLNCTTGSDQPDELCFTYLDWCGLRPMSCFEYEKLCRGFSYPVVNEYAWGTAQILRVNYYPPKNPLDTLNFETSAETHNHILGPAVGVACLFRNWETNGGSSTYRVGFAAKTNTTRITAGAGYYGNLDLTGNANEGVMDPYRASEITLTKVPGDGVLTPDLYYNTVGWPGINPVNEGNFRGGTGSSTAQSSGYVSMRISSSNIGNAAVQYRGVR